MFNKLIYSVPAYIFFIGVVLLLIHATLDAISKYDQMYSNLHKHITIIGSRLSNNIETRELHKTFRAGSELEREFSYYAIEDLVQATIYDGAHEELYRSFATSSATQINISKYAQIMWKVSRDFTPYIEFVKDKNIALAFFPLKMPVRNGQLRSKHIGILLLEFSYSKQREHTVEQITKTALINAFSTLVMVIILSLILYVRVLKRIKMLSEAANAFKEGKLNYAIERGNDDELGRAIEAFNAMSETIQKQFIENEKIQKSLNEGQRIAKFGIWEWNIQSNELWWSDGIYLMFGLEPQLTEATYEGYFEHVHPEDKPGVIQALYKALENKEPYHTKHRIIRSDTTQASFVQEYGEVEFDEKGNAVFMKGTVQDITPLILAQRELESYKNTLEIQVEDEINKRREKETLLMQQSRLAAMGEMIGNIAHQWRQPLNALSLAVGNIENAYETKTISNNIMERFTSKAYMLIDKMSSTIDDFRNFFQPDKRAQKFKISEVINEILSLVEASLNFNHITVDQHIESDVVVNGYKNELSQVILNLISNAKDVLIERRIKTPQIIINVTHSTECVDLYVEDNAGGIKPKILERIFEPYYTTKDQGKGTGIGLYMSKMIIEDHMNGKITVSNTERGAQFHISFKRSVM